MADVDSTKPVQDPVAQPETTWDAAPVADTQARPESTGQPGEKPHHHHLVQELAQANEETLPAGYFKSMNFIGSVVASGFLAISLYLGFVLPANALANINADIGPSSLINQCSTVFTLVSGVLLMLVGRLGDIFGRRYFLIGGQCFGVIGGIVCATAQNVPTVIGGTVLVGVAGAVQLTFSFVIAELVPNKYRAYVDAGLFACTIPFAAMGPAFARLLVTNTHLSWRAMYVLNIVCCSVSAILYAIFYHPPNYQQINGSTSRLAELKKFDWIGLVLYTGGLVCLFLGLSWGPSTYPWTSAHTLSTLIIGCVVLLFFGLWNTFAPIQEPLMPRSLFKNRNFLANVGVGSVGTIVYFSMNLLWPLEIEHLFTTDNIEIGWIACSTGAGVVFGQIMAGLFYKRIGFARWQLVASTVIMTAFLAGLAALTEYRRPLGLAFTVLGGFGVGYLELVTIVNATLVCKPGEIGFSSCFLGGAKQVAGSIAASIYVAILNGRLTVNAPKYMVPAILGSGVPESELKETLGLALGGSDLHAVAGITDKQISIIETAAKLTFAQSFKIVFLASIAFGGLAIICAFLSQDVDEKMTGEVARKLRHVGSDDAFSSASSDAGQQYSGNEKA
ncbi:siderophore iron transporter [Xylona heveae TC161]|uniref:Siderophore iron transporter n=1 Tax=Xylona heveae (strain CBS 132557 / TC161) TaxID=1328760 RepID=A0A165GLH9_XYLHT|nr:siderophore iron transporter [Xylona heveae TC161]KZF22336.1 siderophore iron transporter [Xylona heveae TC161]